jgi:hypothetical protein
MSPIIKCSGNLISASLMSVALYRGKMYFDSGLVYKNRGSSKTEGAFQIETKKFFACAGLQITLFIYFLSRREKEGKWSG